MNKYVVVTYREGAIFRTLSTCASHEEAVDKAKELAAKERVDVGVYRLDTVAEYRSFVYLVEP